MAWDETEISDAWVAGRTNTLQWEAFQGQEGATNLSKRDNTALIDGLQQPLKWQHISS